MPKPKPILPGPNSWYRCWWLHPHVLQNQQQIQMSRPDIEMKKGSSGRSDGLSKAYVCSIHARLLQEIDDYKTGPFLGDSFGGIASRIVKVEPQTSGRNISQFRGMFLASWPNGFNIGSIKYCPVKLSPCGRRSTIAKPFGLKNCLH
jgi:hypothetical protein